MPARISVRMSTHMSTHMPPHWLMHGVNGAHHRGIDCHCRRCGCRHMSLSASICFAAMASSTACSFRGYRCASTLVKGVPMSGTKYMPSAYLWGCLWTCACFMINGAASTSWPRLPSAPMWLSPRVIPVIIFFQVPAQADRLRPNAACTP